MKVIFFLLIAVLCLGLRLTGNNWGLVTKSSLQNASYPNPVRGGNSRIIQGYAYDESNFMGFLQFYPNSKIIYRDYKNDKITFFESISRIYRSLLVGDMLRMIPVGPMLFGTFATGTSWIEKKIGVANSDIKTVFYNSNRMLTAIFSTLTLLALFYLIKITTSGPRIYPLIFLGCILFTLQPASVVHGHWVTYNPIMTLFKLFNLTLFIILYRHLPSLKFYKSLIYFSVLGMLIGISIAMKYTGASVALAIGIILLTIHLKQHGVPGFIKKYWTSAPFFFTLLIGIIPVVTYLILLSPSLLNELASEHSAKVSLETNANWISLIIRYFLKTLPSGIGWPVYISGLAGIIVTLGQWKKIRFEQFSILTLAFVLAGFMTTLPLGMMPQRSLTVYALWVVFSIWFYQWISTRINPWLFRLLIAYVIAGSAFASLQIDYYLVNDYPDYRNKASQYVINNIPHSSKLILHKSSKHGQIDVTMYETHEMPPDALYQYEFLYTTQLDKMKNIQGYAIYPDHWKGEEPLAIFHSSIKKEPFFFRVVRMLFGFHRCDQLIDVPSFGIYKINR